MTKTTRIIIATLLSIGLAALTTAGGVFVVMETGFSGESSWGATVTNHGPAGVSLEVAISGGGCVDSGTLSCGAGETCDFETSWSGSCPPASGTPMTVTVSHPSGGPWHWNTQQE